MASPPEFLRGLDRIYDFDSAQKPLVPRKTRGVSYPGSSLIIYPTRSRYASLDANDFNAETSTQPWPGPMGTTLLSDASPPLAGAILGDSSSVRPPQQASTVSEVSIWDGNRSIRPLPPISVDMVAAFPPPSPRMSAATSRSSLCLVADVTTGRTCLTPVRHRPLPIPPAAPQSPSSPSSASCSHTRIIIPAHTNQSFAPPPRGRTHADRDLPLKPATIHPPRATISNASSSFSVPLTPSPDDGTFQPPEGNTFPRRNPTSDLHPVQGSVQTHQGGQSIDTDLDNIPAQVPLTLTIPDFQKIQSTSHSSNGSCDSEYSSITEESPPSKLLPQKPNTKRSYSPQSSEESTLSRIAHPEPKSLRPKRSSFPEDWAAPTSWNGPTFLEKPPEPPKARAKKTRAKSVPRASKNRGAWSSLIPQKSSLIPQNASFDIWTSYSAPWGEGRQQVSREVNLPKVNNGWFVQAGDVIVVTGEKWEGNNEMEQVISQLRQLKTPSKRKRR